MKRYLIAGALSLAATIMTAQAEEIFFNLKESFNARILADNADKKFLQKKRRLKDQEVIVVPIQK